jgi:hypothetical protein
MKKFDVEVFKLNYFIISKYAEDLFYALERVSFTLKHKELLEEEIPLLFVYR